MNLQQAMYSVVVAGAVAGLTGCGSGIGSSGSVPEAQASSSAATAPSSTPTAPASSAPATSAPGSATTDEVVITIKDFTYELPASIAPGATVTVVNEDAAPHTVTAQEGGGFNAIAAAGETVTFTAPREPGEYPVICTYHPQMSATLVVR